MIITRDSERVGTVDDDGEVRTSDSELRRLWEQWKRDGIRVTGGAGELEGGSADSSQSVRPSAETMGVVVLELMDNGYDVSDPAASTHAARRDREPTADEQSQIDGALLFVPEEVRRASAIRVADLGAVHGVTDEATRVVTLNEALFDDQRTFGEHPTVTHLERTLIHEMAHAWDDAVGISDRPDWFLLSGWLRRPGGDEMLEEGLMRYVETRPGWDDGPSDWVHAELAWFVRPYSAASPAEDFADVVTVVLIGWDAFAGGGEDKRDYVKGLLQ